MSPDSKNFTALVIDKQHLSLKKKEKKNKKQQD